MQPPLPQKSTDEFPVDYQSEDTSIVMRLVQAGESQALLGIGSMGKSNFLDHLVRRAVRRGYLAGTAPYYHTVFVLLNPHHMIHATDEALKIGGMSWQGYEIMMNRMRYALHQLDDDPLTQEEREEITQIQNNLQRRYSKMFDPSPLRAQSAIRRVEDIVNFILEIAPTWKVVFILDELEEFVRVLPAEFFQSLRGIRDDHRRRVMYLVTSRYDPFEITAKYPEKRAVLESFIELFNDFTNYLRPLDPGSANFAVRRFCQRYQTTITATQEALLQQVTGCHPGLMRRAFIPVINAPPQVLSMDKLADYLIMIDKVYKECETVYRSLSEEEQDVLHKVANGNNRKEDEPVIFRLNRKHLISRDRHITIPLLVSYLLRQSH